LLADRAGAARPGPDPVRVRPPRPVPRAVRVPVPQRPPAALPGAPRARAADAPHRGLGDLHQRLLPRHRDSPQRGPGRARDGRAPDEEVGRIMSTADVGLSPDPKNPLNDVSTMNKSMEYMAFELPVVAFDLLETRVSAGDAAVYVEPNVIQRYAEAITELMDD